MPFICAFVPEDDNFRDSDEKLLGRDGGAGTMKAMENVMDIHKVLPDELANPIVVRNSLIATLQSLITQCWPFNAAVIHEGPGNIQNLRFQKELHILVENSDSISPTLWETGELNCTDRRLNGGEVT